MSPIPYPRFGLFNTEERILHSNSLDQDYQVGIWFPFSYASSDRKYPALYILDGEFAFGLATGLIPILIGAGEIPELIVVGLAHHGLSGWAEHGSLRERDFLPPIFQAPPAESRLPAFTGFFKEQLFPLVEAEYRGSPDDRLLFGFSAGGLFAIHCLLTQPGMFRRLLAASCTWPKADDYLLDCETQYAALPARLPADLYLAIGELDAEQLPGFRKLAERLITRNYPGLRLFTEVLEGEGHSAGVLAKTLLNGLRAVL